MCASLSYSGTKAYSYVLAKVELAFRQMSTQDVYRSGKRPPYSVLLSKSRGWQPLTCISN